MGYNTIFEDECRLFIHLKYNTTFGEHLYLVGNHGLIGDWNIHKALKLETDNTKYPIWTCEKPIFLPRDYEIQFKLLVKNMNDETIRWEEIPSNRRYKMVHQKALIMVI